MSFITELELLSAKKYEPVQLQKINATIKRITVYNYNDLIKQSSIELRQKYSLKIPDAIIAATGLVYDLPLFTADRHFSRITEITISLYTF